MLVYHLYFKQLNIPMNNQSKSFSQLISERKFAILILLFELGMTLAHGFGAYYTSYATTTLQSDYSDLMILYTLTAFLALLGYGLIVAYSGNSAITGLVTTLFVVAISIQLTPLLLQFWYNVFNGFGQKVEISLKTERVTMALCTSLLVALTSLIGRLGKAQTFIIIIIYNIGWTLSFQATQYIQTNKSPTSPQLYDDFGTNYVYVFAGVFAFFTSIILNFKQGKACPTGSKHSAFISLIGTGFIFACFPFTGILFPSSAATNIYRNFRGPMNIYFALSASVICTYISSAVIGGHKVRLRQSLVGVLSGGVAIGTVAGTINNIGACIAIGSAAGFISGIYLKVLHPRLNSQRAIDHLGIFGPILICSILGGLVISPAMYKAMMNLGTNSNSLGASITGSQIVVYQLVYIGVTALISSGTALLAGLAAYKFRDSESDFDADKLVSTDYGIFRGKEHNDDATAEKEAEPEPQAPQRPSIQPQPSPQPHPRDNQTNSELVHEVAL